MVKLSRKLKQWLLPTLLILFICEVICLPYAIQFTYADRSISPIHSLTYTTNQLSWDNSTDIDNNGIAHLKLFDFEYQNVEVENKEHIVAPGTEGHHSIRLKNQSQKDIDYTVVLYQKNPSNIPVKVQLNNLELSSIDLPKEIQKQDVLTSGKGKLTGGRIQDFDISWIWEFSPSITQDEIDTTLGNHDEAMTLEFMITVEVNGRTLTPDTSDHSFLSGYIALMFISAILLILLVIDRKKQVKEV